MSQANIIHSLEQFAPFILILLVFYFLIIRPQQKNAKKHKEMLASLQSGDNVVTTSGFYGRVIHATNQSPEITLELAPNVRVVCLRQAVANKRGDDDTAVKTKNEKTDQKLIQSSEKSSKVNAKVESRTLEDA